MCRIPPIIQPAPRRADRWRHNHILAGNGSASSLIVRSSLRDHQLRYSMNAASRKPCAGPADRSWHGLQNCNCSPQSNWRSKGDADLICLRTWQNQDVPVARFARSGVSTTYRACIQLLDPSVSPPTQRSVRDVLPEHILESKNAIWRFMGCDGVEPISKLGPSASCVALFFGRSVTLAATAKQGVGSWNWSWTIVQTYRLQGRNVLQYLRDVVRNPLPPRHPMLQPCWRAVIATGSKTYTRCYA
jgi:hypothetical protein